MKTTTLIKTTKSLVLASLILGTSVMADGASLYKKCAGCHGMDGSKIALGKSKNISQMSEEELNTAMNGYKDGSYGGAMKGLMKGQVARLSKDDIALISKHIANLK